MYPTTSATRSPSGPGQSLQTFLLGLVEAEARWARNAALLAQFAGRSDGSQTVYDAAYVAAAELLDCSLLTGDGRLARATGIGCPVVVAN